MLCSRRFKELTFSLVLSVAMLSHAGVAKAQSVGAHVTQSPQLQQNVFDVPADCDIAVGAYEVVAIDNHQISVWTKASFDPSNPNPTQAISPYPLRGQSGFWASEGANTPFDPRVIYDMFDARFWIVACEYTPQAGQNPSEIHFCVAVTETADPTGSWHRFRLDIRDWPGISLPTFANIDFPNIVVDGDWLYISAWTTTSWPFPDPPSWSHRSGW